MPLLPSSLRYTAGMEELISDIKTEFPGFKIVDKEHSLLMKFIDVFLKVITFWNMRDFMSSFTTTIGCTVYVPSTWAARPPKSRMIVLRHERVHMRQRARRGLWYSVSYLLFPLPTLWAYCRMRYEMEAYEESMRAILEYYGVDSFTTALRKNYVQHFTGPEYFWTWPWKSRIESWYDSSLARILADPAQPRR